MAFMQVVEGMRVTFFCQGGGRGFESRRPLQSGAADQHVYLPALEARASTVRSTRMRVRSYCTRTIAAGSAEQASCQRAPPGQEFDSIRTESRFAQIPAGGRRCERS